MLEQFFDKNQLEVLNIISNAASTASASIYIIGGAVRDMLLDNELSDIDIVLVGNMYNFVKILKEKIVCNVGKSNPELRTIRIAFKNGFLADFATSRQEIYAEKKGIPLPLNFGCSLKEDILRRDFSINSLALSLNKNDFGKIIDYVDGLDDLENKKLRILHDKSFLDDPTRIIRGFKFSKRLGFSLEEKTKKLQEEYLSSDQCGINVSCERAKKEMLDAFKLLNENIYNDFFKQKIHTILSKDINEIPYNKISELITKYNISDEKAPFIYFASIFLKETNYPLFSKMNLSKEEYKLFQDIKFLDGEKYKTDEMAIFRSYSKRTKESLVLELILKDNDRIKTYLENMSNVKIEITGDDLVIMGIPPSKNFKLIFDKILEEKMKGNLPDKVSELRFVRKLLTSGEV